MCGKRRITCRKHGITTSVCPDVIPRRNTSDGTSRSQPSSSQPCRRTSANPLDASSRNSPRHKLCPPTATSLRSSALRPCSIKAFRCSLKAAIRSSCATASRTRNFSSLPRFHSSKLSSCSSRNRRSRHSASRPRRVRASREPEC